jgi:hypothetical protein
MSDDFQPEHLEDVRKRIERALFTTFQDVGLVVFDVTIASRPPRVTADIADFWGGYRVEFKLIEAPKHAGLRNDIEALRRNALKLGPKSKFQIEISRYEHVEGRETQSLDGYRILVYSAEMIVGEKLRAICQQMPEYGPIIKRSRPGAARARDFVDIHTLVTQRNLALGTKANRRMIAAIFKAKRVPFGLLNQIDAHREFHRPDFAAVQATVKPGVHLESFDHYVDFVLDLVKRLQPLRNE